MRTTVQSARTDSDTPLVVPAGDEHVAPESVRLDRTAKSAPQFSQSSSVKSKSPAPTVRAQGATLVEAIIRGDRQTLAAIVRQHQQAIYGYLRARLLQPSDAEDLCQEVFLRCFSDREKLARATAARHWLLGIARNLLREHVRRLSRRREVMWTELCLELESLSAPEDADDAEALAYLPQCLEMLGKSAREALELRYHSKLRLAEIAERLGRSEGAVKLLLYRSRQALQHCLQRKLDRQES